MTTPTIGRVVHYYASIAQTIPNPAIVSGITEHESGHLLNLACFNREGSPFNAVSIPLIQADQDRIESPHACWMPYQIEQAKKNEPAIILPDATT